MAFDRGGGNGIINGEGERGEGGAFFFQKNTRFRNRRIFNRDLRQYRGVPISNSSDSFLNIQHGRDFNKTVRKKETARERERERSIGARRLFSRKLNRKEKREREREREREAKLLCSGPCVPRYGIPSSFDIILHSSRHDKPRIRGSIKSGST